MPRPHRPAIRADAQRPDVDGAKPVRHVHAVSARPEIQPEIRLNYLSTDEDRRVAIASIRQARQIMTARALRPYAPEEWLPGAGFTTDAELSARVGDIATTIFHPVGTCRMGQDQGLSSTRT